MSRSKVGGVVYYYCRTYKDQSRTACTKHTIRHDRLEEAVLWAIRQQVYLWVDAAVVLEQLDRMPPGEDPAQKLRDAAAQKERELSRISR